MMTREQAEIWKGIQEGKTPHLVIFRRSPALIIAAGRAVETMHGSGFKRFNESIKKELEEDLKS